MKKQLGRSMIEMLGVLAIIGVLSIGGIALYRHAVNHHQANSILDDANRYAFVITERGGFPVNTFIDNVQYEQTSTYNLDAFSGVIGGQFGIVATDVPKGVCEALIEKAAVDYKVRVIPAETAESVGQLSTTGIVYDSLHTDICNEMNDVVLFFGDTSTQCNAPDSTGYTPCTSNADCCGGYFCWYPNDSDNSAPGMGECQDLTKNAYRPVTETMSDGKTWMRSRTGMNWWSAQNWCAAQGLSSVSRADIGCGNIKSGNTCDKDTLNAIREKWTAGCHWLEDYGKYGYVYYVAFSNGTISAYYRYIKENRYALCH